MFFKEKYILLAALITTGAYSIDIRQAQHSARTQRPALKAQQQSIIHHKKQEAKVRADFFPQLTAQHVSLFDQEHSTINSSTHTIWLRGTQLIFDPNGPQLQAEIASRATDNAQHLFTTRSHQVTHDATHAFLDAWLLSEKDELIKALQSYSELRGEKAESELAQEQISIHEYAAIQAELAAHTATIQAYPHERESAYAVLYAATAQPEPSTPPHLSYGQTPSMQLKQLSFYLEHAYANRPELKSNQVLEQQFKFTARSHRRSYLPSLTLHGNVGRTFSGTAPDRGTDANIGVTASWSFFDGMRRSRAAEAADADVLRTQFEQQELRNTIRRQVTTSYHTIKARSAHLKAAQAELSSRQSLYNRAQATYSTGSLTKVAHAEHAYQYQQALHALRSAHAALRKTQETLALHCGYSPQITAHLISEN